MKVGLGEAKKYLDQVGLVIGQFQLGKNLGGRSGRRNHKEIILLGWARL